MNKIANKVGHYGKSPRRVWFRRRAAAFATVATVDLHRRTTVNIFEQAIPRATFSSNHYINVPRSDRPSTRPDGKNKRMSSQIAIVLGVRHPQLLRIGEAVAFPRAVHKAVTYRSLRSLPLAAQRRCRRQAQAHFKWGWIRRGCVISTRVRRIAQAACGERPSRRKGRKPCKFLQFCTATHLRRSLAGWGSSSWQRCTLG
jgi:hypothetical protein